MTALQGLQTGLVPVPHAASSGQPADRGAGPHRALLRFGVRPYLVLADTAAWAIACGLTGLALADAALLLALTVGLLAGAASYRSRLELSVLDDIPVLLSRTLAAGSTLLAGHVALDPQAVPSADLLPATGLLAVLVILGRAAAYSVVRRTRAGRRVCHATLVLGAGNVGGQVTDLLLAHAGYGLLPVGYLDADPLLPEQERRIPLLGSPDKLANLISEFDVRAVVVAFSAAPESQMIDIIRTCDRLAVEVFTVPRLYELHRRGRDSDELWGLPLVRLRKVSFRRPTWRLKRLLDVAVSSAALLVLSPVLLGLAAAVRLQGPGVLFRQERVGMDGRPFTVLKFRSMQPEDEQEAQTQWSIAGDARVTRLGRLLRASSLDELPQLWNVLTGTMTLVGPRPERPHFAAQFSDSYPRYAARHRVPAGMTGWAQIHGLRGDTSIEDRARFDNYYIENWSLWYDITIMLRTAGAVLRRTGS